MTIEAITESTERHLSAIEKALRDVRRTARAGSGLLFGTIIATGLGLATLMAKGFHWL